MNQSKNTILVFIDWFLPGYKAGGPITSVANIVTQLNRDYRFFVLTTNRDYGSEKPYKNITADCWVERAPHLQVYYHSGGTKSGTQRGTKKVMQVARETGIKTWYITGVYSPRFAIMPLLAARRDPEIRIIVAPRGMLSAQGIGVKRYKKSLFLGIAKLSGLFKHVTFQSTNHQETRDIKRWFPKNRIIFAPNLPKPLDISAVRHVEKKPGALRLISIGRISPEKNTLGALTILQQLSRSGELHQDELIVFHLHGEISQQQYWQECQAVIETLPPQIDVKHFPPSPPAAVPELLSAAHFLFLPSRGENYGHAIIEALSVGRPVIISDKTPWRGLEEVQCGFDIPLSDKVHFRETLLKCLRMDNSSFRFFSSHALAYAKKVLDDHKALDAHKKLFSVL